MMVPWVLERKTLPDLESSIIDGRYKSQKARLQLPVHAPPSADDSLIDECLHKLDPRIFLMVESAQSNVHQAVFSGQAKQELNGKALNVKVIQSAQIHSQIRDGVQVIHSANVDHSATLIMELSKSLQSQLNLHVLTEATSLKCRRLSYHQWSKNVKPGAQETVYSLFRRQIRMLPGVTPNLCDTITSSCKTPAQLIAWLRSTDQTALLDAQGHPVVLKPQLLETLKLHLLATP
eukprot:Blabericola_migrator_1__9571@NODE_521_length_7888_cov_123_152538_g398_i0_p5_GENE_NODE_521_length_7888_cov_123_152538_g398_i0NODE_521_length_7888_cov_123_152538_g398_i0_p5_ORF_typecomplete_len234_score32_07ERCC4/PF02732_15/4_1e14DUF4224/PF13986_6/0_22_NODE_521_length_7888_cov_123_152538_g398_i049505651